MMFCSRLSPATTVSLSLILTMGLMCCIYFSSLSLASSPVEDSITIPSNSRDDPLSFILGDISVSLPEETRNSKIILLDDPELKNPNSTFFVYNSNSTKETETEIETEREKRAANDDELSNGKSISFNFNPNLKITVPHMNQTFIAFGQMARGVVDTFDKTVQRLTENSQTDRKGLTVTLNMMDDSHQTLLHTSMRHGETGWLNRQKTIDTMWANKEGADPKSTLGTAYAFSAPNSQSIAMANTSIMLEYASRAFMEGFSGMNKAATASVLAGNGRTKRQTENFVDNDIDLMTSETTAMLERIDLKPFMREAPPNPMCNLNEEGPCDASSAYRTFSGWCNNLQNPSWGKSVSIFDRMIPPVYADGISMPRSFSATGEPLPSPRYVSQMVHVDVSHLSQRHTLMFMQYGQFLDHDITFTPVNKGPGQAILDCRDCESARGVHPECWPISVPQGDGYYPNQNENGRAYCLPFTRSLPGQQRLGPREQINQNSGYLDSSQIYGENICKMETLRAPGGYLNVTVHPSAGKSLLPQVSGMKECKSPSSLCFHAGDPRSSEQPALAAVHTIYLREHNRLVTELRGVNPHWNDERLFQETRRIMNAQSQHITYNEFLPKLLGASMVNAYGLTLNSDGYYLSYDSTCKGVIYNEFASSAFRFGHSLIRSQLPRMDNRYNGMSPNIPLRDGFFNSDMLYKPLMVDEILRGLLAEPMEQLDPFITNEIRNHLFEDKKKQFSGLDLIALNLHRGRDHGLQGYNAYRVACNLRKAYSFQDLSTEIPADVLARLQKAYAHVDDIDLFTGSLVERSVVGGLVGPTIACIIGNQFKRLRQCDRFWYETNDSLLQFSPRQLAEIRKATLSKLICTNFDMPSDIQKDAFGAPHKILNPRIPCERLPTLNIEAWRDTLPYYISSPPVPAPYISVLAPPRRACIISGLSIGPGETHMLSPCVKCLCTSHGTKCASIKVTNCHVLIKEAVRHDILRDEICMAQCGYMLGSINTSQNQNGVGLGRFRQYL